MKWLLPAILLITSAAHAKDGADIIYLKNGVTFPHRAHQSYLKSDCKNCHRKEVGTGKIPGFGKDIAHRMCKTCHAIRKAGPAACKDCHKNN
jgi:hypothetical protein